MPGCKILLFYGIIAMEGYFQLASYNEVAKSILGPCQARRICQEVGRPVQSWEEIKTGLKEKYLPLNCSTTKMNEFL